ncbi:glyoxalase [candidate division KSB1 bacterium RBG_16_48_16]|nr:MAG: glyoxalase [candidate division KSB1 bacterium RBG_16_48_16]
MPRIVHFEISANDPEKVVNFYKSVFGWDIKKWDGPIDYWMVTTGPNEEPGINGGIFVPKELFSGTVNTVEVQDIDSFLEKVKKNNGQVVTEKMAIPGVGYQVYCKDVEGTLFGLHQMDPNAGQ